MSFDYISGVPSDVALVLNGLTYYNNKANLVDTINITLFDGIGTDCLTKTQLGARSIYDGCYVTNYVIQVTVLNYPQSTNSNTTYSVYMIAGF